MAADTGVPDPLLFAAALEVMHVFLDSDVTRQKILAGGFLTLLHDSAILLPYIRGPKFKGGNNSKFQELWRQCESKYGESSSRDVLLSERHNNEEGTAWRSLVPELKDLQHPLMHRVLLHIVMLVELFSDKAQSDPSGMLQQVSILFNRAGREELLIGPATGLVTCPDYDVKIQCLRCIQHVLRSSAAQFDVEEMGWLLRYLTPVGIGVGKQEVFLKEVINLTTVLVKDTSETGRKFRSRFAKAAIRESFDILRTNCRRDTSTEAGRELQLNLSLAVIELIADCSRPISGNLRKFLRRADLLGTFVEVLTLEDGRGDVHVDCRRELFNTFTGREMGQILLPLITGADLRVHGVTRYFVLVRMADVLMGKPDYRWDSMFDVVHATNEAEWWPTLACVNRLLSYQDPTEQADHFRERNEFITVAGIQPVLDYASAHATTDARARAHKLIADSLAAAEHQVRGWWNEALVDHTATLPQIESLVTNKDSSPADQKSQTVTRNIPEDDDAGEEKNNVQQHFATRLQTVNQAVMRRFQSNLNIANESGTGVSGLNKVAEIFAHSYQVMESVSKRLQEDSSSSSSSYDKLMTDEEYEDSIMHGSRLTSVKTLRESGIKVEKLRQKLTDINELLAVAKDAQVALKTACASNVPRNNQLEDWKHTQEWARMALDPGRTTVNNRRVRKSLVEFFDRYGATIIDPGVKTLESFQRKSYKYNGDASRMRDAARLLIEFKTVDDMVNSYKEMLNANTFHVVRFKNRFRHPNGYGGRWLIVNVALSMPTCTPYICECKLIVNSGPGMDPVEHKRKLELQLSNTLHTECQVLSTECEAAAKFLTYTIGSLAVRDGDRAHLLLQGSTDALEVCEDKVHANDRSYTEGQLFVIERLEGEGVVRIGDVIRLKCVATGSYIDADSRGTCRCRYSDYSSGRSNLNFVVEGVVGDSVEDRRRWGGWLSQAAQVPNHDNLEPSGITKASHKKLSAKVLEGKNLHSEDSIRLVPHRQKAYLSVMSGNSAYVGGSKLKKVRVLQQSSSEACENVFLVMLESCFSKARMRAAAVADEIIIEKRYQRILRTSHMCTSLPLQDMCPPEGGMLHRRSVGFWAVARKQACAPEPSIFSTDSVFNDSTRMALVLAASLRCVWALTTLPCTDEQFKSILSSILGSPQQDCHVLSRILVLVTESQCIGSNSEIDLTSAWLPAKLLHTVSAVISKMPTGGIRTVSSPENRNRESASELKAHEQMQFMFLSKVSVYIHKILTTPLLRRLEMSTFLALGRHEVMLLRSIAVTVQRIALVFFGSAMCKGHDVKNEDSSGQHPSGFSDTPEIESDHSAYFDETKRCEIFAQLVPRSVLQMLVHAMLYGMHREALAYQANVNASEKDNVKLVSSLVNRSIYAIVNVMRACADSEKTACDHDVCEAVSQAMNNGSQVVPRARIAQLLRERVTEHLRKKAEALLEGSYMVPGERILTIAFVWSAELKAGTTRLFGSGHGLVRSLVVLTNRHNIAMLADSTFDVLHFQSLDKVTKVVVRQTIRQFVGLTWEIESENGKIESHLQVLIFESVQRKRNFLEALRLMPTKPVKGDTLRSAGLPFVMVRGEVMAWLHQACKKERGEKIHSVTFIKPPASAAGSLDSRTLELLAITKESITIIDITQFVTVLDMYCDHRNVPAGTDLESDSPFIAHRKRLSYTEVCDDSDSDDETLPQTMDIIHWDDEARLPLGEGRNEPRFLKNLQGVWFMAQAESHAKLHFDDIVLDIQFFCDGEKQRWRQQLAMLLDQQDKDGTPQKGWSVMQTEQDTMQGVKKTMAGLKKAKSTTHGRSK
eukprot:TRINITY_DN9547_c1_g1_i1.p1 TRINITY_DN9547_c1_g1~~TRINITY_DN9547_c1_g1_i1.p1  ORF type:complete len:1837 (+),score=294.25 TRINITY_DN9547_c1_g1_i1:89-5512(+)